MVERIPGAVALHKDEFYNKKGFLFPSLLTQHFASTINAASKSQKRMKLFGTDVNTSYSSMGWSGTL